MPLNEEAKRQLNALLSTVNLENVTAESTGFTDLEEGYYLCEVEEALLTISKSGNTQTKIVFKTVEDGVRENEEKSTSSVFIYDKIKSTKGRKIFKYYPLKDEASMQRFVNDMLKFESKPGKPLLPKEVFMNADDIDDGLSCLKGMRIVINVSYAKDENGNPTTNDQGQKSIFYNAISWQRAEKIQLPF